MGTASEKSIETPAPAGWLTQTRMYLELIRFSHTVFALPFALLAAAMAFSALPAGAVAAAWWRQLAGVLLCMVSARSAAMAFNRLADARLDALNPRTAGRHLPAGLLSWSRVAWFAALCSVGFVAATLLFLPNRWPLYLSLPVLAFLGGYSFTKRFTALAHFWLGAALALSPLCAWLAITGTLAWAPVLLGLAVLLWVAGFDILYACQDYQVDRQLGLHSVPVWLGIAGALRLAAACHLGMLGALAALGWAFPPFGWVYGGTWIAIAALLVYEHAIVRPDDLSRVNQAFFHVNALIGLALLAAGVADLLI